MIVRSCTAWPGEGAGVHVTASFPNRPRRRRCFSTVARMRRLLVLLAALSAVAGCSTSIAGHPSPVPGAAAQIPTANGVALPPRPRELKLDGIGSCAPLAPPRLAKLDLDRTLPSTSFDDGALRENICSGIGSETNTVFVLVAFVTRPGLEAITTGPTAALGPFEPVQVAGFPGVVEPRFETDICTVDIDVAAGQFVDIDFRDGHWPTKLSREELCQGAITVGEEVMEFLQETGGHS
jgi:hypothetical protein